MYQSTTNRSRQLVYIALGAAAFSLFSIGYKYFTTSSQEQAVNQLDCVSGNMKDIIDSACNTITFDERAQFSSLSQ
ncbi:MAG: hypothetical protein OEX19_01140 [Gammaproteobacteria bacterium]|nr:hypothetical protein [Gammaproteobacteria bacterium]